MPVSGGRYLTTPAGPANPLELVRRRQGLQLRSIRDSLLSDS